ncbi:DNA repair protein RadC [Eilatimonas milleporae]|uniref:DNA repair protein RadC n=1 Tax=Eilatimonas milleporae TaxID=911205 RepID=A0A3M0C4W7_9PROT|nr:DNA repair protein RadC [Eilatimonas milleporae]RMB04864.1 DNA repair protein RadC [Eilatimonas milleporae]
MPPSERPISPSDQAVAGGVAVPHHKGHRARLRQRFLQAGPDSLADYELLELVLFLAIPRRDVKPLAKDLLTRFGSLAGVLGADIPALSAVDGLSETAAVALKTVHAAAVRVTREAVSDAPVLSGWQALNDYVRTALAHEKREQFRVLFLDRKNRLIVDEAMATGTIDRVAVYPREVVRRALELDASAVILVHNHPSGDPRPSKGDIAMTRMVSDACDKLDITVHDHLVVGRSGNASFKTLGLL